MKKQISVVCLLLGAVAALALAGCSAPQNGLAFSPDGRSLAYIDKNSDGIVLKNFETGASELIYTPVADFKILGLFWPPDKNAIYFTEFRSSYCDKKSDYNLIYFKKLDPETRKKQIVITKKIFCNDKYGDSDKFMSFAESSSFDPVTMSVALNGLVLQAAGGGASPFASVSKKEKKNNAFNFVISPGRKYVAYAVAVPIGKPSGKSSNDQEYEFGVRLMSLSNNKTTAVTPLIKTDGNNPGLEDMRGLKWNADGTALYYSAMLEGRKGLIRYEPATGGKSVIFKDAVLAFEPFAAEDRLFILGDRNGSALASIIGGDGSVEAVYPAFIAPSSLKISPDGSRAAALYLSEYNDDPVFFPVVYDLKNLKDDFLVRQDGDNLAVGGIFYQNKQYGRAISYYEKAGADGQVGLYLSNYFMLRNDAALAAYEKIMARYIARKEDPHFEFARILEGLREFELAENEYLKVSEPNMGVAFYFIAANQNSREKAVSYFQKAIEVFRNKGCYAGNKDCQQQMLYANAAPYDLANALVNAGHAQEARAAFESMKTDYPLTEQKFFEQIRGALGELCLKERDFKGALANFGAVLDSQMKQPAKWRKENAKSIAETRARIKEVEKKMDRSY